VVASEADKVEIVIRFLQQRKADPQQLLIPVAVERQLVVRNEQVHGAVLRQIPQFDNGHFANAKFGCPHQSGMPSEGVALGTHQAGLSDGQRICSKKELENFPAS
jgi:hypothetical protein